MSASLHSKIQNLRDRLEKLNQAQGSIDENSELSQLHAQLQPICDNVKSALKHLSVLVEEGINVEEPRSLQSVKKRAQGILDKFSEEPTAATLKNGSSWRVLIENVKALPTELNDKANEAWKNYRNEVFQGRSARQIWDAMPPSIENEAAFKEYDVLYQSFSSEFKTVPSDPAVIAKVRIYASKLKDAEGNFDFDYPASVTQFLKAVSDGGASLSLLTDEVLEWITEKGDLDTYQIRRRSNDGR